MAKSEASTLVVLNSFIAKVNGADIIFRAGESISRDHPAVKKYPQLFGEQQIRHEVEQATAAPGEKRDR